MAQEADASPEEEYLEFLVTLFGGNTDRDNSIRAGFMGCIEALKKENGSVISAISKHVGEYFKANVLDEDKISVPKLHRDDNLLVDSLPSGIINDLCESVKQMVCTELATSLLSTAIAFATWSHFIPNTLQELRQVFESVLLNEFRVSLRDNTAVLIRQMLSIFEALENVSLVPRGGLHPITTEVMFYICYAYKIRDNEHSQGLEEGKLSPPVYIVARMTELLESSLKANSKNYNNPTLGFFSIMNNRRFIELEAKLGGLEPLAITKTKERKHTSTEPKYYED
ncbi:Exocyst complex component EXO70B1 [Spatholobus suberectus]|nr:Exocyst complex component EXO70B1 [Spatholobus suberectus]